MTDYNTRARRYWLATRRLPVSIGRGIAAALRLGVALLAVALFYALFVIA